MFSVVTIMVTTTGTGMQNNSGTYSCSHQVICTQLHVVEFIAHNCAVLLVTAIRLAVWTFQSL